MENILTIYHGSKDKIVQPIYGLGKNYNDYGQGFYCTENLRKSGLVQKTQKDMQINTNWI